MNSYFENRNFIFNIEGNIHSYQVEFCTHLPHAYA